MDFLNTPEKKERRLVHIPMGRFGEAIEQARAALFRKFFQLFKTPFNDGTSVASDDSSYMTVSLRDLDFRKGLTLRRVLTSRSTVASLLAM
jgi:hypothetical protein